MNENIDSGNIERRVSAEITRFNNDMNSLLINWYTLDIKTL